MHDEMMERGKGGEGVEAGLGEGEAKVVRGAVLKMDCRYVNFIFLDSLPFFSLSGDDLWLTGVVVVYYLSSRCCSSARSSIARMWGMRRFWGWRRIFVLMIISMRLGCVCFMRRISRGQC